MTALDELIIFTCNHIYSIKSMITIIDF